MTTAQGCRVRFGRGSRRILEVLWFLKISQYVQSRSLEYLIPKGLLFHEPHTLYLYLPPGGLTNNITCTHFYAMIADGTVRAARRPVELAGDAPFHPHRDTVDLHAAVQGRSEVVLPILVRWSCKQKSHVNNMC